MAELEFTFDDGNVATVPASGISEWVTAIEDGGIEIVDQSSGDIIRDAADIIANESRKVLKRYPGWGTTIRIRMVYKATDEPVTDPPIIRAFGASGDAGPFFALRNANDDASVPVRTDTTSDSISGDFAYTTPGNDEHSWDCDGYKYFIIGVERAYSAEDAENAYLEAKII